MEKNPKGNSDCPVCKTSLGILSKKLQCSLCKAMTCREHCVVRDQVFCEVCEKNSIKQINFPDMVFQIKALKNDLNYLEKEKKKYSLEISAKNDTVSRLEKQYKTNTELHQEKITLFDKKITQESEKIRSEENLILYLHKSLTESQKSENAMIEKLNFYMHEFHMAKNDHEEMVTDQKFLISKIDKLNSDLRGYVSINSIGKISCSECKQKIKNEFLEVFETSNILNGRDSFFNSVEISPINNLSQSKSRCYRCSVI